MAQLVRSGNTYGAAFECVKRETVFPASVARLRDCAFTRFADLGLPTTKLERWRFTNVAPIAQTEFSLAEPINLPASVLEPYALAGVAGPRATFVNGRFAPDLSSDNGLPAGVEVRSIAEVLAADAGSLEPYLGQIASFDTEAFTALNTALLRDGALVRIPANVVVESPIQILFVTAATNGDAPRSLMAHPRLLVLAGENSQVRLVESYAGLGGDGRYLTNAVTEVVGGENSVIDHYKLLLDSFQAFHIAATHIRLARSANFSSHSVTLGGGIVRNDIGVVLDGEGINCTLNGLYLANDRRLVDNHTTIHHARPHCCSHELYKGILDGQAHAVFNGKIVVAIDAQKTDAKQTNKTLLLSEDAQINTKPELEIFADDVKCTHGATVGQLDEDALFYLRSRGLGFDQARNMLIHAFASDLLNRITVKPIRAKLEAVLLEQLPGDGGGT